jgi:site-specific DNA recombinase
MIAAIYARKSTEQNGVGDEEKSVARQIAHAKAYATRKGWLVEEDHVYVDDGISGAEFVKRPGFIRLMNALSPRPPFQVLVMSEESRLGREQIETAYALKQITDASVRVFFYLEDRERTLDNAMDKVMLSLTNFAAEMEREKARQRTYDAMLRKAKALHVTGGKVYGYDNVEVLANGTRQSVNRQVNPEQAAVVRRIFELYAAGIGMLTLAHRLNEEGVKPPRGRGWAPSGIREMLHRPLYRGEIVWNRSQKIVKGGTKKQRKRPESEWLTFTAPELRIIPDDLWQRVKARLDERAALFPRNQTAHKLIGRPRYQDESAYLLVGFVRCSVCGGPPLALNHGPTGRTERASSSRTTPASTTADAGRLSAPTLSPCARKSLTAKSSARSPRCYNPRFLNEPLRRQSRSCRTRARTALPGVHRSSASWGMFSGSSTALSMPWRMARCPLTRSRTALVLRRRGRPRCRPS